jgi:hypothetical protein
MTGPRSAEDRISLWLEEEAEGQLPDRVLDATFERTRELRQSPGTFGWRPFPMTTRIAPLIAAGATVIVVVIGAAMLLSPTRLGLNIALPAAGPNVATNPSEDVMDATADLDLAFGEFGPPLPEPPVPRPRVFETGFWAGPIEVATSDHTITGELRLDSNHELEYSPTGPPVNHAWGSLTGRVDGVSCTGSLAYSFYRDGPVGGTIFLRCGNGSYLGGELTSVAIALVDTSWRLTAHMDGVYRPAD